jgi:N-acetylmuramoyl-L-alanine amidase
MSDENNTPDQGDQDPQDENSDRPEAVDTDDDHTQLSILPDEAPAPPAVPQEAADQDAAAHDESADEPRSLQDPADEDDSDAAEAGDDSVLAAAVPDEAADAETAAPTDSISDDDDGEPLADPDLTAGGRPKPERRPIVPHWIPIAAIIALALVVFITGVGAWLAANAQVEVPDVTDLSEGLAEVRLSEVGLGSSVTERRFDDSAEGTVLEQSPQGGSTLQRGETVGLVVSAGSDELEMPDVVGQNVRVARARLESEGLLVKVDAQESDRPKDTVISTNPAPGATVRTGEIVRITIAAEGSATDALLPYSLDGATFVIDPSEAPADSLDVPLEVSRRLQSLLEASGAQVIATRSAAETTTGEADRAAKVPASGVTAIVGLEIATSGEGMSVLTLDEDAAADAYQTSEALGDEIQSSLARSGYPAARSELARDLVLSASQAAGARTVLGSTDSEDDVSLFRDPAWADGVARAIYQGLGERFGSR